MFSTGLRGGLLPWPAAVTSQCWLAHLPAGPEGGVEIQLVTASPGDAVQGTQRPCPELLLYVQHGCTPSPCRTCGPPLSEGWHGCSDEIAALLVSPRSASAADVRYKTIAASSDQEAEPYTFEPFREVVVQSLKLDADDTGRYPVPPAALAYVDLVVS